MYTNVHDSLLGMAKNESLAVLKGWMVKQTDRIIKWNQQLIHVTLGWWAIDRYNNLDDELDDTYNILGDELDICKTTWMMSYWYM